MLACCPQFYWALTDFYNAWLPLRSRIWHPIMFLLKRKQLVGILVSLYFSCHISWHSSRSYIGTEICDVEKIGLNLSQESAL